MIQGSPWDGSGNSLAGQVAVVTGGARGIGNAIVASFQRAGARVCIVDCDRTESSSSAAELSENNPGFPVQFVVADLAELHEIEAAARAVQTMYGHIDILVNNAGIEAESAFPDTSAEAWERILAVNLRAPFFLTQALLPVFRETGGAVINMSSIHATHAFPGSTSYACSKAGLIALTRNLALELAPRGIRVNAICPGYIDTRLWEEYLQKSPDAENLAQRTNDLHPLGRRGMPEDVAQAALFLATKSSFFMTGTHLVVDGGLTIRAHP